MAVVLFDPNRTDLYEKDNQSSSEDDDETTGGDAQFLDSISAHHGNYLQLLKYWIAKEEGGDLDKTTSPYQKLIDSLQKLKSLREEYEALTLSLSAEELDRVNMTFCELSI